MSKPGEGWHTLGVAAMVSAAVHIAAAGLLSSMSENDDGVPAERPDWAALQPPTPEDEDEIELGIEKSDVATVNWLGFEDPTPHEAPRSSVEQPELALNPSEREMQETATPPPAPPETTTEAETDKPQEAEQPVEAVAEETPIEPSEPSPPTAPTAAPAATASMALANLRDVLAEGLKLFVTEASAAAESAAAQPSPSSAPPPPPQPPLSAAPAPPSANPAPPVPTPAAASNPPAIQSEKESPAASMSEPIDIVPKAGRTAARQGLEIITRRISFQNVTLASARPRNPVVAITFGRDGSVIAARILKSSGASDVDEPVLNSVFGWKATGKDLEKIPASSGDSPASRQGITIEMRIILLD